MVAPAVEGIDLFKIAGRSISGWVPSFKMGSAAAPVKLPFCSQLEERLLLWLEYHPLVVSYARGDIGLNLPQPIDCRSPSMRRLRLATYLSGDLESGGRQPGLGASVGRFGAAHIGSQDPSRAAIARGPASCP